MSNKNTVINTVYTVLSMSKESVTLKEIKTAVIGDQTIHVGTPQIVVIPNTLKSNDFINANISDEKYKNAILTLWESVDNEQ